MTGSNLGSALSVSSQKNGRQLAVVSVLLACVLFSTSATGRAYLDFPGSSISVGAWRVFLGGIGLAAYAAIRYGTSGIRRLVKLPVVWVMALAVLAYQISFFIGAARIGVAMGTLGALATAPFFAGVLGWIVGTGKPSGIWAISTVMGVIGLALITGVSEVRDNLGFFAVFISGVMYAIFTVFGVRLTRTHDVTGAEVLGAAFGIGAVLSLPIVLFTSAWINSALLVGFVLYIGLATTALGYILFGNGLTHLSPGTVSTLTLAEPVLATLMGVFILGEAMNLRGWIGCAVIIGALALLGIVESRTPTNSNLETSNA
ncbi:MAG: DMT family transporter [Candidatus Nanopelagicales bacterium]